MRPTICRTVVYRSRTGNYSVPAVVTATRDTLYRPGVEDGFVPDLSSDTHVHLAVLTPGLPGKRADADDFVARPDAPVHENVGGTYQEHDVPFWDPAVVLGDLDFDYDEQPAGTWAWPPRA